jgi:hypothetical protein
MTTIGYDEPIADYIGKLNATGHVTHTTAKKTSVTVHHNAGKNTFDDILRTWTTRESSAHFDVDAEGKIAQFVKVDEYAWAVGNHAGNEYSISIEQCNSTLAPDWEVAEVTWKATARLTAWLFAHVIGSVPSKYNVFPHQHWSATECPGPYMNKIWNQFLGEVGVQYKAMVSHPAPPSNGPETLEQIAKDVIAGKYGNGQDRINRLKAAGYNPTQVQNEVNALLSGHTTAPAKSIEEVAQEVIHGDFGNDPERSQKLKAEGYDPEAVQEQVNKDLK